MKQKQKRYSKTQQKELFKSSTNQNPINYHQKNLTQRFIKENYSTLPINPQNKLTLPKQQIINRLNFQFQGKLQIDSSARRAIEEFQINKINKLNKIQDEIDEINRQNGVKLKMLSQMEKDHLKRIQEEIKRDDEIQIKLIRQYEKIAKEEQKIKLTKSVIRLREKQDWIVLQKQQKKLGLLQNIFQKRQILLGRNKSLDVLKKKQKQKQELKKSVKPDKSVKRERNKKNADELKEMGRQFLQHAKKVQIQAIKSSVKLMDINKKSIDYLPQIKQIIRHHVENLSKPIQKNESLLKIKKPKKRLQNGIKALQSIKK